MHSNAYMAAFLLMSVSAEHTLACSSRFDGPNSTWLSSYNPFAAADSIDHRTLRLINLSGENCRYRVYFHRNPATGSFSDKLVYNLTSRSAQPLLSEDVGAPSNRYIVSPTASGYSEVPLNYSVVVNRGQLARPGNYMDRVEMVLFSEDGYSELDRHEYWYWISVQSVAMINLAGGGLATSVQFGKLLTGATKSLILEARSNTPYTMELTSSSGGDMLLDPPVAGQTWSIPYRVSLNGDAIGFDSQKRFELSSGSSGEREHALTFQILDADGKRAGLYRDVITAKISVAY
jgi:hypothetical protein